MSDYQERAVVALERAEVCLQGARVSEARAWASIARAAAELARLAQGEPETLFASRPELPASDAAGTLAALELEQNEARMLRHEQADVEESAK